MAQYNKDSAEFRKGNSSLFEVFMLADKDGNVINDFGGGGTPDPNPGPIQVDVVQTPDKLKEPTDVIGSYKFNGNDVGITNRINKFTNAGGTIENDQLGCHLNVGTVGGDTSLVLSKNYHPSTVGYYTMFCSTLKFATPNTGVHQKAGVFDISDGFYFELDGVVPNVCMIFDGYIKRVAQSSWNGNKLDGTDSDLPITIDWEEQVNLYISYDHNGSSSVKFGIIHDGEFILAHEFNSADVSPDNRHFTSLKLPMMFSIANNATVATPSKMSVSSVNIYGVKDEISYLRSLTTDSPVTISTNKTGVLAVRLKNSLDGSGNRSRSEIRSIDINSDAPVIYEIAILDDQSNIMNYIWKEFNEYCMSETSNDFELRSGFDNGDDYKVLYNGIASPDKTVCVDFGDITSESSKSIYQNIDSTDSQVLVLVCKGVSSNANVFASIRWNEVV